MLKGIGASRGYGIGKAVVIKDCNLDYKQVKYAGAEEEKQKLHTAVDTFVEETKTLAENLKQSAGEKEAEMNKRIAESLTPSLIKYYYIKQWKGELPKTVLGESSSFMINLEQ